MTSLPSFLRRPASRFLRDERGSIVAEAVIVLPVFLWAYLALFVYWDAFRSMNTVQKAAYTISDMVSREMVGVTTAYVNGLDSMLEYLVDNGQTVSLRVTSVTWSETNDRFEVHWSRSPDNAQPVLTTATLQNYAGQIPNMSPGDYVVIVEVWAEYEPTFEVGMDDTVFTQFIVTRPRFLPCIPMDAVACPVT
jgi:Flp pilus assembly protein TadG